jgi:flagellin
MSISVNTNLGAVTALASLRATQANIAVSAKLVQTGYRVADAMDNASTFSVAQGIRGNLQAFRAVLRDEATRNRIQRTEELRILLGRG